MTSAAEASPSAILRFSSARASLTALARSSARNRCGDGLTVAVSDIWCFASSHSSAWADLDLPIGRGLSGPLPWVLYCALLLRTPKRAVLVQPPFPAFPTNPTVCSAWPFGRAEATPSARVTATSQVQAMRLERVFSVSERLVRVWTSRAQGVIPYGRPGRGPCSDSKACLAWANSSRARSSVSRSWVAITLVRSNAPAGGTAGCRATLT